MDGQVRAKSDRLLFPSRINNGDHLSTRQYARLLDEWISAVGMDSRSYGTHSLRQTKVAYNYKKTGNNRAVQLLLGHIKLESTVRYIGVKVDDTLNIAEQVDI